MLGQKIGEERGKVTSRRVLEGDETMRFVKMEVSFEMQGSILGAQGMNIGTYQIYERGPGQMYGQGQGIVMTADGDGIIWNGHGVGRMVGDAAGTIAFAFSVAMQTTSEKLAALNHMLVIGEHKVDMQGNAESVLFEWKA